MAESLRDWLALREPFDAAARSVELTGVVSRALSPRRPVRVVDLGTGRGSNIRYLSPRLPLPQHWLLIDRDAELLGDVPRAMADALADDRCRFETKQSELGVLDPGIVAGRDLVTASALLDLVSEAWLRALAAQCRVVEAAALFALTYDGTSQCTPSEPEDDAMRELMNRHQRSNDKGFGRAAGPDAVDVAERAFVEAGYRVQRARSDWRLPPDAVALQRQLVEGWAAAARDIAPGEASMIQSWCGRRLSHIDGGRSYMTVGHVDLAALPCDFEAKR